MKQPNQANEVEVFMSQLEHPMKEEVEKLRAIILGANDQITEHIKWNAPSFCYQGEDRITFNLHARGCVRLIFHRGAKVRDNTGFKQDLSSNLLIWIGDDRAKVEYKSMQEVEAKKAELTRVVNQWLEKSV